MVSGTEYLNKEIEAGLTKLLEKYRNICVNNELYREIAFNRQVEDLRQRMESHKQFNYEKAY